MKWPIVGGLKFCLSLLPGLIASSLVDAGMVYGQNQALMEEQNGTSTQLVTGLNQHDFISVSRGGRLVAFSTPDPATPNGVTPSSDIYVYDRATRRTRRVVNHTSGGTGLNYSEAYRSLSATPSPNGELIAYGVQLMIRQGSQVQSTRELNIARSSDAFILANPTLGRGPVTDSFESEFVGISWDPGGASFVTPSYVPIVSDSGLPANLPAIVRFSNQGGNWSKTVLTTPRYLNNQLPVAAQTHIYPAVSPSGAGLAFFSIFWPDVLGQSQPVTARIIVANSDGSNPFILATFNPGWYPTGLSWTEDGSQLYFGIAPQATLGPSILPSANLPDSVVRAVSTSDGTITSVVGADKAYWPNAVSAAQRPVSTNMLPILQMLLGR